MTKVLRERQHQNGKLNNNNYNNCRICALLTTASHDSGSADHDSIFLGVKQYFLFSSIFSIYNFA
jgi:hypothetical protein